ncbi:MAG: hypothetical protein KME29_01310 [Calothrix sp. FI2-JRJ7]|jgi:hypothetical protein|nr:hypothetical protein [Calothrix sp. FI2-JRJ7]
MTFSANPNYSLVKIKKTFNKLNIVLPRKRIDNIRVIALTVKYLIVAAFGLSFFPISGIGLMAGILPALGITVPLLLIWLAVIDQFIISDFGNHKICFNEDNFSIELWIFTFRRSIKSGKIRDIRDVFQSIIRLGKEDNLQLESHQEKEMITIQTEYKRFSFGIGLSAQECLWIAQEIKDWLRGR